MASRCEACFWLGYEIAFITDGYEAWKGQHEGAYYCDLLKRAL